METNRRFKPETFCLQCQNISASSAFNRDHFKILPPTLLSLDNVEASVAVKSAQTETKALSRLQSMWIEKRPRDFMKSQWLPHLEGCELYARVRWAAAPWPWNRWVIREVMGSILQSPSWGSTPEPASLRAVALIIMVYKIGKLEINGCVTPGVTNSV